MSNCAVTAEVVEFFFNHSDLILISAIPTVTFFKNYPPSTKVGRGAAIGVFFGQ